ncbi:hypothetical protein BY996DRAFT_6622984, partial [Phakopsora pachyrhizi]
MVGYSDFNFEMRIRKMPVDVLQPEENLVGLVLGLTLYIKLLFSNSTTILISVLTAGKGSLNLNRLIDILYELAGYEQIDQELVKDIGIYINCNKEKWGGEGFDWKWLCGSACCAKAYVKDIERRQFQQAELSISGRYHSLTGFNIEKDNNDVNEIRDSSKGGFFKEDHTDSDSTSDGEILNDSQSEVSSSSLKSQGDGDSMEDLLMGQDDNLDYQ